MALSITHEQLAIAESYANAGDYKGGWQCLASIGDNYADNAYVVTTGNGKGYLDNLMHRLVKNYWDTVAGPGAYTEKFDSVARQHFEQYIREIARKDGVLPDSRAIEQSYRDAVTQNGLPPQTAIDGAITQSFGDAFDRMCPGEKHEGLDWTDGLGMEDARQVPSDVYNDLDPWQSFKDLVGSGGDTFWDQRKKDIQDSLNEFTDSYRATITLAGGRQLLWPVTLSLAACSDPPGSRYGGHQPTGHALYVTTPTRPDPGGRRRQGWPLR